jgi:2-isopropylmalate synthase
MSFPLPVDSTFEAIKKVTGTKSQLLQFFITATTSGTEAQREVMMKLEKEGYAVTGQGADTDGVVASAKTYINALNKLELKKQKLMGM